MHAHTHTDAHIYMHAATHSRTCIYTLAKNWCKADFLLGGNYHLPYNYITDVYLDNKLHTIFLVLNICTGHAW